MRVHPLQLEGVWLGLKSGKAQYWRLGFSCNSPWYWIIWEFDSHLWGSPCKSELTSCGTLTTRSWPKVSLVASRTSRATAAIACRHLGHPVATLSSSLEREATGLSHGPTVWVNTPIAVLSFSVTYRVNGLARSGSPKAGADIIANLHSSKAFCYFSVQFGRFSSGPVRNSYKGWAIGEYPGIQILQNPAVSKNSWTCQQVLGVGILRITSFLNCSKK